MINGPLGYKCITPSSQLFPHCKQEMHYYFFSPVATQGRKTYFNVLIPPLCSIVVADSSYLSILNAAEKKNQKPYSRVNNLRAANNDHPIIDSSDFHDKSFNPLVHKMSKNLSNAHLYFPEPKLKSPDYFQQSKTQRLLLQDTHFCLTTD